jgi:MFS family permease
VTLSVAADPITEEFGLFSIKLEYSQAGILLLPLGVLSLPHPYGILVGKFIVSGWFLIGTSIGAMITPPLVVWLSVTWSWQAAFIVTGLMAVGVAAERC